MDVRQPDELNRTPADPHVLLVAENDLDARTLERWLVRRGWKVTRARRPAEALALWRSCGAQVALVDLDDDGPGGLGLLSMGQTLRPPRRAVISTRDLAAAHLPPALRQRLGIEGVAIRPCHMEAVACALVRAFDAATAAHLPPIAPALMSREAS
jgi:ActR/RegA family two-component response regulator